MRRPLRLALSITVATAALSWLAPGFLHAQDSGAAPADGEVIDRVVAVVGDSAIFRTQLQEEVLRRRASGVPAPEPDDSVGVAAFQAEILEDLIDQTLILYAASRDTTITISDTRVDEAVEAAWADELQRFGSEAQLRSAVEAAGWTLPQYRGIRRLQVEQGLLFEAYVESQRRLARAMPVEESDMRELFESEREALGERPPTLTFEHVMIAPRPSDSVRAAARGEAEEIRTLLAEGEDFAELAQRFSDDPGSGERGGELGWIRRGSGFVQEFEDAAFALQRGQVSGIVETQFGSHILQVERVSGAERMVRHILVAAEPTPADVEAASMRAAEIRAAVEAGTPLSDFVDEGTEVGLPSPTTLTRDQLGQLPTGLAEALAFASQGDVLGPIELQPRPDEINYAVVFVSEIREAGEITYEDVREQIRGILQDRQFRDRLLERLRAETYVDRRL